MAAPLTLVPLGGTGEIGMNLNLYAIDDAWLMVDCGIGFERSESGRTQVILPDPRFITRQRDKLLGLVITHVHEDHIGGVARLWRQLRCPVYCTPFAALILRRKLGEFDLSGQVPIRERVIGSRWEVGPFDLQSIALTHSTVESTAIVLRAPEVTVLHTGDWKLDEDPVLGHTTDIDALVALGDEGVDVVVGDSTNATRPGWSRSEREVVKHLDTLIGGAEHRVVVACFSSNVARLGALLDMARTHERHPVIVGRSMDRMLKAATGAGYLRDVPQLIAPRDHGFLPRERVLIICTGTQGEPFAALTRMARQSHPHVVLEAGDRVIFSSKIIPGNEAPIGLLHRLLREQKVEVISELEDPLIHASGHPCQEELQQMYEWVNPGLVVPVHGTPRHLEAHARVAEHMGISASRIRNGDVLELTPDGGTVIGRVPTGRLVVQQ